MAVYINPLSVHYRLDEVNGTTINDESGYGINAVTSTNPPQIIDDSTFGSVMEFNGSDQYLTLSESNFVNFGGDQTIMMWLYPTRMGRRENPYAKAYGGEGTITQEANGSISYYYGTSGVNTHPHESLNSGSQLVINQWNHIAIVRDLALGKLTWYINGVVVRSKDVDMVPAVGTYPAYIGKGYVSNYTGRIAQFRLFSVPLGGDEIRDLMQRDASGLRIHWPMDRISSDNNLVDESGHFQTGSIMGNPELVSDGTFGACLQFNGASGIKLENVDFPGDAFSASMWVRPESPYVDDSMISYAANSTYTNAFLLIRSGDLRVHLMNGYKDPGQSLRDGEWHHVVQTWRRYDGRLQVFIDGEEVYSGTIASGQTVPAGGTLVIGREQDTVGGGFQSTQDYQGRMAHFRLYDRVLKANDIKKEMEADMVGLIAYRKSFPIDFRLHDDDNHDALYIDDQPSGHALHLDLVNSSDEIIQWNASGTATPSDSNYAFLLRFRAGTLVADTISGISLREPNWKMEVVAETDYVNLYFLPVNDGSIDPQEVLGLTLDNVKADGQQGTRGTVVELKYDNLSPGDETQVLKGNRIHHLNIVNHRGRKDLGLQLAFQDSNAVLNSNNESNDLQLLLFNGGEESIPLNTTGSEQVSQFILQFEGQADGENKPWALGTQSEIQGIAVAVSGWAVTESNQGTQTQWTIETANNSSFDPGEFISISINGIRSSLPAGLTMVKLHYVNIPGFQDGVLQAAIAKSPLVNRGNDVGIGTDAPTAQLGLGRWNSGYAGPNGGTQLHLSGRHNTGANIGGKKLLIDGYDNDGSTTYPIYVMDENSGVDFYIRNRQSSGGNPLMYFRGNVGIGVTPTHSSTYKLNVNGSIRASALYDSNNSAFLMNPSGTSILSRVNCNSIYGSKFYAASNTSRYCQPNGQSKFNRIDLITDNHNAVNARNNSDDYPAVWAKNEHSGGWDYWAGGNNHYGKASSITLKKDVSSIENALDMIGKLEGVRYTWKKQGTRDIGFIAEEVAKIIPEAVALDDKGDAKAMSYDHITPVLVNAVKEQQTIIEAQGAAIKELQEALKKLTSYVKKGKK